MFNSVTFSKNSDHTVTHLFAKPKAKSNALAAGLALAQQELGVDKLATISSEPHGSAVYKNLDHLGRATRDSVFCGWITFQPVDGAK